MTEAEKKIEPKLIAEVANAVALDDVHLDKLSTEVIAQPSASASELALDFSFRVAWARVDSLPGFLVRFDFDSSVREHIEAKEDRKIYTFSARYILQYRLESTMPSEWEERIPTFSRLNGVINAWPYVRADLQNMTCRAGLPPMLLPVFRPGKPTNGSVTVALHSDPS